MAQKHPRSLALKYSVWLLISILPFNILALFTANTVMDNAIATLRDSVLYTMNSSMELLDNRIDNSNYFLYSIPNNNADCIELFFQKDDWTYTFHRYQVFTTVTTDLSIANAADCIFFYMEKKNDLLNIATGVSQRINNETIMALINDHSMTNGRWHLVDIESMPYLLRIFYDSSQKAYCGAFINLKQDVNNINNAISYLGMETAFRVEELLEKKGYLICTVPSTKAKVYLNVSIPTDEIYGSINFIQRGLYVVFIVYFFVVPILYILFRKYIALPLRKLNNAHNELKNGNDHYRITLSALSSEFHDAYASFNDMADKLDNLRTENVNKELAYKQLQLDYLQLQIRPHFLLNSFNLLYTLVQVRQVKPAQQMILYLSNYFRYMFKSEKKLDFFDKEMSLIKEYLTIADIQYPNTFTVSYQLDPVLSYMRVPPLLLHSFVENIIRHALTKEHINHIVFYGAYEDGYVTFQISDDGKGMTQANVDLINSLSQLPSSDTRHVGIRNAVNRLKYYYGEKASVSVESELNQGATFTIVIPYVLEVGENDDDDIVIG